MKKPGIPINTKRFDPATFLETVAQGRTVSAHPKKQIIFAQGDAADFVFYIKKGKVKVTVLSEQGKEAVVALLGMDEFLGEGCLIGQPKRLATATAMTECVVMRVRQGRDHAGASGRARFLPDVHLAYSGKKRPR